MLESFRDDPRRLKANKRKPVRLFVEELEGRCLLSHQLTANYGITTAPDGNIWFLEQDRLGRIDPKTGIIQEFAIGTAINTSGFGVAPPIVAAPDGAIWFLSNNQVARYNPSANALDMFSVPGELMPSSLAVGPDGNVWVGESRDVNLDLVRIDPGTGAVQEYALGQGNGEATAKIAIASDGSIWAAWAWTPIGWVYLSVLNPATGVVQKYAAGISLDDIISRPDGGMWLMEGDQQWSGIPRSDWAVPGTQILHPLLWGGGDQNYEDTFGFIWSPDNGGIAKVNPNTGQVTNYSISALGNALEFTQDAAGEIWFTSCITNANPNGFVGRLDPTTGLIQVFDQATELPSASSNNAPPAAGATINATAGIDFRGAVATFTPQIPVPASGVAYQASIDWGDGTTSSLVLTVTDNSTYDVTAGHTYQTAGTYSIQVTIGNYNPANPLGDNPVTVFSTANVQVFDFNPFG